MSPAADRNEEVIALAQEMTDRAQDLALRGGWVWDNKHPTFRAIATAFADRDLEALRVIYTEDFN
jgi:hypothetical protein